MITKAEINKVIDYFKDEYSPDEQAKFVEIFHRCVDTVFADAKKKRYEAVRKHEQKKTETEGTTRYERFYKNRFAELSKQSGMSISQIKAPGGVEKAKELINQTTMSSHTPVD